MAIVRDLDREKSVKAKTVDLRCNFIDGAEIFDSDLLSKEAFPALKRLDLRWNALTGVNHLEMAKAFAKRRPNVVIDLTINLFDDETIDTVLGC